MPPAVEPVGVDPGLLHEFELPFDIGVKAHKEGAFLLLNRRYGFGIAPHPARVDQACVLRRVKRAAIGPAPPQQPMAVVDLQCDLVTGAETVARVGAADMRPDRAIQPQGVVLAMAEIIVGDHRPQQIARYAKGADLMLQL